jgi:hypothetical protein
MGGVLLIFLLSVGIASSGKAQSVLGDILSSITPDAPVETDAYIGVDRGRTRTTSVTVPVDPEDAVTERSISGSYVAFDPKLAGDSCYEPGSPQTFCFRAESYTSDSEHVLGLSLKFPKGWIVTDVRVQGSATCDVGSFGSFTWDFAGKKTEVNIFHQRQQGNPPSQLNDHCVATYCVDLTPKSTSNPAVVSWIFEGDAFADPPHDTCSTDGYYDCAQSANPPAVISTCRWEQIATDPISRMDNVLASYGGRVWSITGYGDTGVSYYVPVEGQWHQIPNSTPEFEDNFARSGCQIGRKVYIYGDAYTSGFTGLWSYNLETNKWKKENPAGVPPSRSGIYAPAWVPDPETGICYLTGGAKAVGGGDLDSVYVYHATYNVWLNPLEDFDVERNFHAAFLFKRPTDQHKYLCVAGGVDEDENALKSTECYDFTEEEWHTPDSSIRMLPDYWWGMGYTQITSITGEQLWLVGGEFGGEISSQTYYYDFNTNDWVSAGPLKSGAVYRTAATALHGIVYHVGGAESGYNTTGKTDRCYVDYYNILPLIKRDPHVD